MLCTIRSSPSIVKMKLFLVVVVCCCCFFWGGGVNVQYCIQYILAVNYLYLIRIQLTSGYIESSNSPMGVGWVNPE